MAMTWVAVAAFALVALSTEFVRRLAVRLALTDRPDTRKNHERPTPYLGGVVIVVGVLVPTAVAAGGRGSHLAVLLLGALTVAVLGLLDDLRPLPPLPRLAVEGLAAGVVVGGQVTVFGNWLDDVLPVLWVVVITNSFNLLDNMDGAAAGVACVTGAALAATAAMAGRRDVGVLLVALAGGCAGFLPHNWTPARIFMGDAGSLFLGFVIATSSLLVFSPSGNAANIAGPLMVTFVATVDTCVVTISRRRAGRPLMLGGTDHVSHRLRRLGLSTGQVALALSGTAAVTCLAVIPVQGGWLPAPVPLAAGAALGAFVVRRLLRVPVYAQHDDHLHAT